MNEEWRGVVGHETSYEVSNLGRMRSLPRTNSYGRPVKGKILSLAIGKNGYRTVYIPNRCRNVHSIVAEAFIGPRPDGMECCHGNGIRSDNRAENLRWDTRSANAYERFAHGWSHRGEHSPRARLKEGQIPEIRALRKTGLTYLALSKMFGVATSTIRAVIERESLAYLP